MGHYMVVPDKLHDVFNASFQFVEKWSKVNRWEGQPLASLIARGNTYGVRQPSGPLGRMYHESQYTNIASTQYRFPFPSWYQSALPMGQMCCCSIFLLWKSFIQHLKFPCFALTRVTSSESLESSIAFASPNLGRQVDPWHPPKSG